MRRRSQNQKAKPAFDPKVIEELKTVHRLGLCLECGKCSALCPMVDLYGRYDYGRSSRAIIERMLFESDRIDDEAFWYCLTCEECTFFCPSGVLFQDFMSALRNHMLRQGHTRYAVMCADCGAYLMPRKESTSLAKLDKRKEIQDLLALCPRCKKKKYVDALRRMAP